MTPFIIEAHDRVLIIAPHPDDESLASAGLIQHALQRGAKLRIIFLTNGESNPWPQRAAEARILINRASKLRWGVRRQSEAVAATNYLGLSSDDVVFLNYPDQGLHKYLLEDTKAFAAKILTEVNGWRPSVVIAPSQHDLHSDHNAIGLLISQLALVGPSEINYLTYQIHNKLNTYLSNSIFSLILNASQRYTKEQAISLHLSQMVLSRNRFIKYAKNRELFFRETVDDHHGHRHANFFDKSFSKLRVNLYTWRLRGAKISIFAASGEAVEINLPYYFRKTFFINSSAGLKERVRIDKHKGDLLITIPSALAKEKFLWVKFHFFLNFLDATGWSLLSEQKIIHHNNDACCIIPCYNVEKLCGEVIKKAAQYAKEVVVVDDGSTDNTLGVIDSLAKSYPNIHVLTHMQNQGKGAALFTAFRYALKNSACGIFITLDGDAQHRPEDIPKLEEKFIQTKAALIIGERDQFTNMPFRSRIGNEIIGHMLRLIYPNAPKDTQSGFRAHNRQFIETIIQTIEGKRYETELYILLLALNHKAGVTSVSIPTLYLEKNASSHFNPLCDSLRIFGALLFWCSIRFIKK